MDMNQKSERNAGHTWLRLFLGLILLAPAGLCCLAGLVIPTLYTAFLSLQDARLIQLDQAEFVGLDNYARLFDAGSPFGEAMGLTLLLLVARVLVVCLVPLLLPLVVNEFGWLVRVPVRLLLTVPLALFAPVAWATTWALVLSPGAGPLNGILQSVGQPAQRWLMSPDTARWALLAVDGLYTLALAVGVGLVWYLAALRGVGTGRRSRGAALVALVASWTVGLLGVMALSFQTFVWSNVLTGGGPARSTTSLELLQYQEAFAYMRPGPGAAIATLVLLGLGLLGLTAGLVIALSRLRLEMVAWRKPSGLFQGVGRPCCIKAIAALLLAVLVLGALAVCILVVLPAVWVVVSSLRPPADIVRFPWPILPFTPTTAAYEQLAQTVHLDAVLVNTLVPGLLALLIAAPIAYLGALGIGAARPLGRWSELLLLPFSPWLFAGVGPLNVAAYAIVMQARDLPLLVKLALPGLLLVVPMLFVLTLFFKGQARHYRAARAAGASAVGAFLRKLILPSLPLLVGLLALALLIHVQDMSWAFLVARKPAEMTMSVVLVQLRGAFATQPALLMAAMTLFGLPVFIIAFLILGGLQALYLDRLALSTDLADVKQ
ncbi:MAG: hypothetical protein KKA73_15300 [Chloroflexi bacterium]|nr:hypothetical protein [Chloroflexota bacterium]MBU1749050.1 hypothetical protein [Chloroflexota bacterium]